MLVFVCVLELRNKECSADLRMDPDSSILWNPWKDVFKVDLNIKRSEKIEVPSPYFRGHGLETLIIR